MSDLYWLTDEQMARLQPYFPKSHGKPRVDDRQVLSGIVFVNCNRLRWRDAPSAYGPHKTLYNRLKRWVERGVFLRKSSLDELLQLFNVLRGDMSLVGPRPIVEAEVRLYGRYFAEYQSPRPGITGSWQVSGRSDLSYRRRVAMDVMYARRRSLGMNAYIVGRTIPAVLAARGSF